MKSVIVCKTREEKFQIPWILILGDKNALPSSYRFPKEQVLSGPKRLDDSLRRPLSQGSKGKPSVVLCSIQTMCKQSVAGQVNNFLATCPYTFNQVNSLALNKNGITIIYNLFMITDLHHRESLSINESKLFEFKPRIFCVLLQNLQFTK